MFLHSYRTMVACREIDAVVVIVPEGYADDARKWAESIDEGASLEIRLGGDTRLESVRRGLEALPSGAERVVCHDAARPFASVELFGRVLARLRGVQGVVPVVPSPDTVKRVREGLVIETVPRDELGLVQTPQAFAAEALVDAHRRARQKRLRATDDAVLLEAAGYRVAAVEGDPGNFKITTPEDLRRAEFLVADLRASPATPEGAR